MLNNRGGEFLTPFVHVGAKMKTFSISIILLFGLVFAQSAPTVELLCPPSLDIIAENSVQFLDTVFIPNDTWSGWNENPLDGEWRYDTCYFVVNPSITTCCTSAVRIHIYSRDGLDLTVPDMPLRLTWEIIGCDTPDSSCRMIIAGWEQNIVFPPWSDPIVCPPHYLWAHPCSSGKLLLTTDTWSDDSLFMCKAVLNEIYDYNWELVFPTVNCTIYAYGTYLDTDYVYYETGKLFLWDSHPEEFLLAPICDTLGNCTDWFLCNYCWFPHGYRPAMSPEELDSFWHHGYDTDEYDPVYSYYSLLPRVIADDHYPIDSIPRPDSIYTNICSGGCRDSTKYDNRFHFLCDSTSAWMTIEWAGGADTIYYGDPGTFWFQPDEFPLPWRRFGVLVDSTYLPIDYEGDVSICLQDVTNAPVIAYGEPVHLHPRGVDPFMDIVISGQTYFRCVPSPPEPVCWGFVVEPAGIFESQDSETEFTAMDLSIAGDVSSGFTLKYSCPGSGLLAIYDVMGHIIFQRKISGSGELLFNNAVASGIYFVRLKAGDKIITKRAILMK